MNRHGKGGFSYEHIVYEIFDTENGKVYLCENGLLANNNTHVKWEELIEYLDDIGYKIDKKDE